MLEFDLMPEQRAKAGHLLRRGIESVHSVSCEAPCDDSIYNATFGGLVEGWAVAQIRIIGGVGIVNIKLTDEQLLDALCQVQSSAGSIAASVTELLDSLNATDQEETNE